MKHLYVAATVILLTVIASISCKRDAVPLDSISFIAAKNASVHKRAAAKIGKSVTETAGKTVWICQSAASKRYHYTASCRGLKRCTHMVLKTTVEQAKAVGLTVCGFER